MSFSHMARIPPRSRSTNSRKHAMHSSRRTKVLVRSSLSPPDITQVIYVGMEWIECVSRSLANGMRVGAIRKCTVLITEK